jgi:halocyanin-like protein
MSDEPSFERRSVLRLTAAGFAAAVAGCAGSSGGSTDEQSGSAGGSGSDGSGSTGSGGATATDSGSGDAGGSASSDFGGWLSGVTNVDGVVDETGQGEVTIRVGTEANGGHYGYSPAAVRVSSGTDVVWTWTGKGSMHNVVEESEAWESELVDTEGHTYSRTFDSAGTVKYFCRPHETLGMKGAVVVE